MIFSNKDSAALSPSCYLLRTNVSDWSDAEIWKAYIQPTEEEAAFRIHKSDLSIRPAWHHTQDRLLAHPLVCFLADAILEDTLHSFVNEQAKAANLAETFLNSLTFA